MFFDLCLIGLVFVILVWVVLLCVFFSEFGLCVISLVRVFSGLCSLCLWFDNDVRLVILDKLDLGLTLRLWLLLKCVVYFVILVW